MPVWFGRVATFLSVMVVVIDLFIPKNLFQPVVLFPPHTDALRAGAHLRV
jgi:hypothetical protein